MFCGNIVLQNRATFHLRKRWKAINRSFVMSKNIITKYLNPWQPTNSTRKKEQGVYLNLSDPVSSIASLRGAERPSGARSQAGQVVASLRLWPWCLVTLGLFRYWMCPFCDLFVGAFSQVLLKHSFCCSEIFVTIGDLVGDCNAFCGHMQFRLNKTCKWNCRNHGTHGTI